MFSGLARALGIVTVKESSQGLITVSGVPADVIARHIGRVYQTKRFAQWMFTNLRKNEFVFPSWFAVEFLYIIRQARLDAKSWGMQRSLDRIIEGLETSTWLKQTVGEVKSMVDLTYLRELRWKAKPHQLEFLKVYGDMVPRYGLRGYYLASPPGTGKALPLSTKIKIPGGWTTMGALKVGDIVTAADGTATTVTGVYPQGVTDVYRITFWDGRTVEASGDHLWKTFYKDGVRQWDIRNTLEIKRLLSLKTPKVYIPLVDSENCENADLPVHPWLIGVLLGDGCLSQGSVHVSIFDHEIRDEIKRILPNDLQLVYRSGYDYAISRKIDSTSKVNVLLEQLKTLGLMGHKANTKFIPKCYLNGSNAQRRALLRGLMDTDGTADKCGSTSYCTISPQLAKDVVELIRSLGGIARVTEKTPHYTHNGERRIGQKAFNINIRHPTPEDLFSVKRKRCRVRNDNQYAPTLKLRISSIEKIDDAPTQCISVSHPDRLYVAGDYVVTHNTFMDLALATCVIPRSLAEVVIIISPKNALDVVWKDTIRELFRKEPSYWTSSQPGPAPADRKIRYFVFHNEALDRAVALAQQLAQRGIKFFVVVDESHNFNEIKSQRTQMLIKLLSGLRYKPYCIWASGSPIKALGTEAIPFLKSCDPLFTPDVERRFTKIFGGDSKFALEVLAHRLGLITYKTSKDSVMTGEKPKTIQRNVVLPPALANRFLVSTIREEMKIYISDRVKFYQAQMDEYQDRFDRVIEYHRENLPRSIVAKKRFLEYLHTIQQLRTLQKSGKRPDPILLADAKAYETGVMLPMLPTSMRREFRECQSVIKALKLKVTGEAVGKFLIPRRAECALELGRHGNLPEIIKASLSKTLVFSTSVRAVLGTADYLKEVEGFHPLVVYQKTNHQLPQIIKDFTKYPELNPVVATFQSLSTAVPMTMASSLVMLNLPFRQYLYDQTISRVYRLGQPYPVTIYELVLDTGDKLNVSTRALDILEWCREHLDVLLGGDFSGPADTDIIIEKVLRVS